MIDPYNFEAYPKHEEEDDIEDKEENEETYEMKQMEEDQTLLPPIEVSSVLCTSEDMCTLSHCFS